MVYKFKTQDENNSLEISKLNDNLIIELISRGNVDRVIELNKDSLYDFIGALHSIKGKIEKEAING